MPTKYMNEWLSLNLGAWVFIIAHCRIRSSPRILSETQVSLGSTKDGVRLPFALPFNDIFVSPKVLQQETFLGRKVFDRENLSFAVTIFSYHSAKCCLE